MSLEYQSRRTLLFGAGELLRRSGRGWGWETMPVAAHALTLSRVASQIRRSVSNEKPGPLSETGLNHGADVVASLSAIHRAVAWPALTRSFACFLPQLLSLSARLHPPIGSEGLEFAYDCRRTDPNRADWNQRASSECGLPVETDATPFRPVARPSCIDRRSAPLISILSKNCRYPARDIPARQA